MIARLLAAPPPPSDLFLCHEKVQENLFPRAHRGGSFSLSTIIFQFVGASLPALFLRRASTPTCPSAATLVLVAASSRVVRDLISDSGRQLVVARLRMPYGGTSERPSELARRSGVAEASRPRCFRTWRPSSGSIPKSPRGVSLHARPLVQGDPRAMRTAKLLAGPVNRHEALNSTAIQDRTSSSRVEGLRNLSRRRERLLGSRLRDWLL